MDRLEKIKRAYNNVTQDDDLGRNIRWLISEVESLRGQLTERTIQWNESETFLRQQLAVSKEIQTAKQIGIPELEAQLAQVREAIRTAMNELGVPGPDYPAPITNAVEILAKALS